MKPYRLRKIIERNDHHVVYCQQIDSVRLSLLFRMHRILDRYQTNFDYQNLIEQIEENAQQAGVI